MKVSTVASVALLTASLAWACSTSAQPPEPGSATQSANNASAPRISDGALRRQVKSALRKTKGLTALDIAVRARNGQITLQGTVKNQEQIELAGNVAMGVPGVTSVKNTLTASKPTNSWR